MKSSDGGKQYLDVYWPEALEQNIPLRRNGGIYRRIQPILCVEDDEDEVALLCHVFQEAGIRNPLHVVTGGQQAITYLAGACRVRNGEAALFPCLVLLDLRLPGKSGFEALEWIRGQPYLANLVVITFSASEASRDLARAHRLNANAFVLEARNLAKHLEFARLLKAHWLQGQEVPQPDGWDSQAEGLRKNLVFCALH